MPKQQKNNHRGDKGNGSTTMPKSKEIVGHTISEMGIPTFKKFPQKFYAMTYQTSMKDWPVDQQRFIFIHREGTVNYKPAGIDPRNGWMTILIQRYERCKPFPRNEFPAQSRDKYTDHTSYQGVRLHSPKTKPLLPGRGMGVGDRPDLKIIGDVDPPDIAQGSVGDCWLLSVISALAEFDGAIKRLFRKTSWRSVHWMRQIGTSSRCTICPHGGRWM